MRQPGRVLLAEFVGTALLLAAIVGSAPWSASSLGSKEPRARLRSWPWWRRRSSRRSPASRWRTRCSISLSGPRPSSRARDRPVARGGCCHIRPGAHDHGDSKIWNGRHRRCGGHLHLRSLLVHGVYVVRQSSGNPRAGVHSHLRRHCTPSRCRLRRRSVRKGRGRVCGRSTIRAHTAVQATLGLRTSRRP